MSIKIICHKDYSYRYIIVDSVTNTVLDDAQGYGYRTPQKAYACWKYKYGGFEDEIIAKLTS